MNLPSFQTHTTVAWPSLYSRLSENVNAFMFLLSLTAVSCVYSYSLALLPFQRAPAAILLLQNAVCFLQHKKPQLQKNYIATKNASYSGTLSVWANRSFIYKEPSDKALTDKYSVYCNMERILDECSVLILYFHTLNFTFTFSTIFHYLPHHFCLFFMSYPGKNLLE